MKTIFLAIVIGLLSPDAFISEVSYVGNPKDSVVSIKGTSNLHDWNMDASIQQIEARVSYDNDQLVSIDGLKVQINASDIQSGNRIMDGKSQDAIKADKYRTITLTSITPASITPFGSSFKGSITCNLIIAGQSNTVNLHFTGKQIDGNQINIEGEHSLEMSAFKIKPPTAMMGSLKTGNEVTIAFDVLLKRNNI